MAHIRLFRHYVNTHYINLGVVEFFLFFASVYVGAYLRFGVLSDSYEVVHGLPAALLFAFVMMISQIAMGVYQARLTEGMTGMILRSVVAIFLLGTALLSVLFYLVPELELQLGRGVLALACISALILVTLLRISFYRLVSEDALKRHILVVGAGRRAKKLHKLLQEKGKGFNFKVRGFLALPGSEGEVPEELVLTDIEKLSKFAIDSDVDEIIVAVDERRRNDKTNGGFPLEELLDCKLAGLRVIDSNNFIEREAGILDTRALHPSWLLFSDGFSYSATRDYLQRGFDIFASLLLILIAWPFMLLTVIAIKLEEGIKAPVIYRQERVGAHGRIFEVLKFRSMRTDAEKDGKAVWAQKNDSRVTRVGAFIRNTRIDELPQIFNVLRGEMSFVGPRPERPQFVEELKTKIPYYDERHRVKPGITGWAQLCYPYGASDEDSEKKLQYDLYYVKNRSLLLDLLILIQTVEVILIGKGVR